MLGLQNVVHGFTDKFKAQNGEYKFCIVMGIGLPFSQYEEVQVYDCMDLALLTVYLKPK